MVAILKGPNLELEEGQRYRATLRLSGVQCFGTSDQVKEFIEDLGFAQVEVFKDADELPKDWPAEFRTIAAPFMSCGRWLQGVWAKSSDALPRPEPVVTMWRWETPAAKEPGTGTPAWAARVLDIAWRQEEPDVELDPVTRQALLAIAGLESFWGWPPPDQNPARGHNNWGNINYTPPGPGSLWKGFFVQEDGLPGQKELRRFRSYGSATDGARDLVRFLLHRKDGPEMYAALRGGNATRIADTMKSKLHYFEVSAKTYALAIENRARQVAAALGERQLVSRRSSKAWWLALPVALGAGYAGYHYRDELGELFD